MHAETHTPANTETGPRTQIHRGANTESYCQTKAPRDTQRAMHTPEGIQLNVRAHPASQTGCSPCHSPRSMLACLSLPHSPASRQAQRPALAYMPLTSQVPATGCPHIPAPPGHPQPASLPHPEAPGAAGNPFPPPAARDAETIANPSISQEPGSPPSGGHPGLLPLARVQIPQPGRPPAPRGQARGPAGKGWLWLLAAVL